MRAYTTPARSGLALGLVLLASFLVAHRGLGASGAFAAVAGRAVGRSEFVSTDPALADRLPAGVPLFQDWIVLEILGVAVGGFASAWFAGRLATRNQHTTSNRLTRAVAGGLLMGLGARVAYGCTSGLGLSGGALLATGAWIFIPVAFGTAVLVTRAVGRTEV